MAPRLIIPTNVISGFPGIGKTFLGKQFPTMFRDLESSDYHWIIDSEGNKIANPEWPKNYIDAIKALDKSGMYKVIAVSSHELIRTEMAKAKIKYTNICPGLTPRLKDIFIDRYIKRQSPPEFISDISKNWEKYIQGMIDDKNAVTTLVLDEKSLDMWGTWAFMV